MQRGRQGREDFFNMGDPFSSYRGFGSFPTLFGGRDPFADPFFTRPFASMLNTGVFGPGYPIDDTPSSNNSKGLVIEELNSDDEGGAENKEDTNHETNGNDGHQRHDASIRAPSVEHPDDDAHAENRSNVIYRSDRSRVGEKNNRGRSFSVESCKVTYGGVDGAYYTSARTRRTDNDGVVLEESKEADATTGQATHRISRGIHDKGHSVTRKLGSDGKVDTVQTLHNLNKDELAGFEEAWKGSGNGPSPEGSHDYDLQQKAGRGSDAQKGSSSSGGWALPSADQIMRPGGMVPHYAARSAPSSNERTKKVVRINID
ncbi:uncharacterized protein LOC115689197 isoform X1 [Syzygium oleosum]|uniref:uncharacterized protein LOC115689197 isoform X1 n=1 Tax=Syzygium oleosum TaxID=219896 RepID=UPI0024BA0334|nr:uncharacterized protein LOC115689197 isoform X1 [Syzygium oleosum]XP_056174006.1 uncharacterized protein LOC115689197 isoform X1 [Syzygium oleosum]